MVEKRSKRLQLIVDLALVAENNAAKTLGTAQNELELERARLDNIKMYYQNYEDQFASSQARLTASDLANSRTFLANLDRACQAQQYQLTQSEQKVERAKDLWRLSHLKSDALGSCQQQAAQKEQAIEDKREQKTLDDLVNQRRSK